MKNKLIFSSSFDKTIKVWNIDTGKCIKTLKVHNHIIRGLILIKNEEILVSCSSDKTY
jgi:WD40 repeat protein